MSEIREQISDLERIIQSFNQLKLKIHKECLLSLETKESNIDTMKEYVEENTTGSILTFEYVEKNCSCPDYVYLRCLLNSEYKV